MRRRLTWIVLVVAAVTGPACSSSPATLPVPDATVAGAAESEAPTSVAAAPAATTETPRQSEGLKLLAHRGVHQTFSREGIDDRTCTATRIDTVEHSYIENTLPSMEAAFAAGAAVVELDIAPTKDGVLAVFHDWEVDCRTNGGGEIRALTWGEASQLDIGYGYTSDGATFPLRGQGEGMMPRLEEVFAAFPEGQFLINFKSNDIAEAVLFHEVVEAVNANDQVWAVYGAAGAVDAYAGFTGARGFSEESITACLGDYLSAADAALEIASCRDTVVIVPVDLAPALAGWPEGFMQSMERHDTEVIISGPGVASLTGIDNRADLALVPPDIDAFVWTDRIADLAPGS